MSDTPRTWPVHPDCAGCCAMAKSGRVAVEWKPISDIGPMPSPHILRGPGLLTAYMKHSGQWYRIDLPEHPPEKR